VLISVHVQASFPPLFVLLNIPIFKEKYKQWGADRIKKFCSTIWHKICKNCMVLSGLSPVRISSGSEHHCKGSLHDMGNQFWLFACGLYLPDLHTHLYFVLTALSAQGGQRFNATEPGCPKTGGAGRNYNASVNSIPWGESMTILSVIQISCEVALFLSLIGLLLCEREKNRLTQYSAE